MKIALLGYGRMGREIEKIAESKNHQIVGKIQRSSLAPSIDRALAEADVAIDFSTPSAATQLITAALKTNTPVVSGTTAWLDQYEDVVRLCMEHEGAFLYASNFSIGVNVFFEINKRLAALMSQQPYVPSIEEIHHTNKLDAPSGTAITLAEHIIDKHPKKEKWVNRLSSQENEISILSKREKDVPGTHIINYTSEIDRIEIRHEAKSRAGFAHGALLAAEWIVGKKGIFSMKDVLSL